VNVPTVAKVCVKVLPVARSGEAMNAVVSLTTVWMALSVLVHVTVVPGTTVGVLGVKA